jgi:class 3 adenylate cyclase
MSIRLEGWTDFFLPVGTEVPPNELKKYRILVFVSFLTALLAFGYLIFSLVVGFSVGVWTMATTCVLMPLLPFALKNGVSRTLIANIFVGTIFIHTVLITSFSGGLSTSITSAYIAIIPMLGVMLINQKAGFIWFFVVVAEILVLGTAQLVGVEFSMQFPAEVDAAFKLAAFLGLVVIVFFIVRDFDTRAERALKLVEEEQKKTQELLLNILPEEVAEELKATGRATAREFGEVTILFSDFKNFTEVSSRMSPQELVEELNVCFYAFDAIMRRHNVEKIKTIGDAYMAASGLELEGPTPPVNMVRAALEMQDFLTQHQEENRIRGKPSFFMRAGIHTGPVVAGVVGDSKFQYDIWGDTVNTASRMETGGEPGRVNISEATFELVKNEPDLTFTARGRVEVKGKGDLEMFFVRNDE